MIFTFPTPQMFVANLKAAIRACSEDTTRPHLNAVLIEFKADRARFVATNGHWLWVNECPVYVVTGIDERGKEVRGTGQATVLVSLKDARKIVKAVCAAKKASTWAVEFDPAGVVRQVATTVEFKPVEAKFPPYAQVIPDSVGGARIVATFDAQLMLQVAASFADITTRHNDAAPIAMHTRADRKWGPEPIVFTSLDSPDALAVLMPFRADKRGGDAELLAKYRQEP